MTAHWTDIIFQLQTDERLITDRPDIHPDFLPLAEQMVENFSPMVVLMEAAGELDWSTMMVEAAYSAMAETDAEARRGRLLQVAALAVAWSDAIALRDIGS